MSNETQLWAGLAGALGFEPRQESKLNGLSGQTHSFSGLALDEINKRVLVFSSELDPRMAAMVHADASANLSDYRLITVRPLTFDIRQLGTTVELGRADAYRVPVVLCMEESGNPHDSIYFRGLCTYLVSNLDTEITCARNLLLPKAKQSPSIIAQHF